MYGPADRCRHPRGQRPAKKSQVLAGDVHMLSVYERSINLSTIGSSQNGICVGKVVPKLPAPPVAHRL